MFVFIVVSLALAGRVNGVGWSLITHDEKVNFDLESKPLIVKTNKALGAGGVINLYFWKNEGSYDALAGGLSIKLEKIPVYWISYCSEEYRDLLNTIPDVTERVWKIALTRSAGTRIVVHCNDVLVVDVVLSDSTCEDDTYKKYYSVVGIDRVEFDEHDTASVSYSASDIDTDSQSCEEDQNKLKDAEAEINTLKAKVEQDKKQIEMLKEELGKAESPCPGEGKWSVPKYLLGKRMGSKAIKRLSKAGDKESARYLKPFNGVKITKEIARYIECFQTV